MGKKLVPFVLIGLAVIIGVALLMLPKPAQQSVSLRIVAAENVWGDIASQIGGSKVSVYSVLNDPSADPHLYESNIKDASQVASADIVIVNGLGYDDFMTKLLNASPNANRKVLTVTDILNAKSSDNPHLWYDVPRVANVASAIKQVMSIKDSANDSLYQQNLAAFTKNMQPLLGALNVAHTNYQHVPVAYTERLPAYLLSAIGLDVKTPSDFASAIENGTEPTPADQAAMQDLLNGKKVRLLLYNAQASSPVTEQLRTAAAQNGIPVVALTETLPANQNYQTWQKTQLDAITKALDNKK